MGANRFDALTRSLAVTLARRSVLRGSAAVLTLGAARLPGVTDAKKKKKKKKSPPTVPASPPPQPLSLQLAYACSGPEGSIGYPGDFRPAQTFRASRTGQLRQIQFGISKANATTGDYFVHLLTVHSGIRGNSFLDVLATAIIPNAAVPVGDSTLTGTFC